MFISYTHKGMPHDFTFLDTEFVEVRGGYNKKVMVMRRKTPNL
jgi:hypothetical protein